MNVQNEGEGQRTAQIFGAGGVEDQAGTRLAIAASTPSNGSTQRVEAREVIALATASGLDGDHQLAKPGPSEDFIQRNIANANPEFGYRNLAMKDAYVQQGGDEALLEGMDIIDGLASGEGSAMLRGSSDQTAEDTTVALQGIFSKAFATHQSLRKSETASLDVSTQKQIENNPFEGYNSTKRKRDKNHAEIISDNDEPEQDPQAATDPMYAAAKEDGLDFYFSNSGPPKEENEDERKQPSNTQTHFQKTMQSSGLRRVGMRKSQSTLLNSLESADYLDQMRAGFSLQQRAEGDWDSYDKLDQQRREDIEKLRFPGAQYLAHQPSMLSIMSARTAESRSKKNKKNKGASGTMGSTGFG
jgi:hypothetical protein